MDQNPEFCGGHGIFVNGSCECEEGWTGHTCSLGKLCVVIVEKLNSF